MDTHDGQETISLDLRQRIRDEKTHHTRVDTAVLSRHEWADTESVF